MKSFMIKSFMTLFFVCCVAFKSVAYDLTDMASKARNAYNASDYAMAAEIYQEIIKAEGTSAPLLYNLGNTYLKAGDYGHAMLYYQRAGRIDPADDRIDNNIRYLESKIFDSNVADAKNEKSKLSPDEKPFFSSLYDAIFRNTNSDSWAWIAALSFILFIVAVAIYIFLKNVLYRKIGFFSAISLIVASLTSISFSFIAANENSLRNTGVIMGYKVNLRQAPDNGAKIISTPLNRGTVLHVIENDKNGNNDRWYKVQLNSKTMGWINSENFQII